jgi:hypothetical protein
MIKVKFSHEMSSSPKSFNSVLCKKKNPLMVDISAAAYNGGKIKNSLSVASDQKYCVPQRKKKAGIKVNAAIIRKTSNAEVRVE